MWKASLNKHMNFDLADLFTSLIPEEEVAPAVSASPEPIRPRTSVVIEEISDEEEAAVLIRRKRPRTNSPIAGSSSSPTSSDPFPEARSPGGLPTEVEPSASEGPTSPAEISTGAAPSSGLHASLPPRPPRMLFPKGFLTDFAAGEEAEAKNMSLPQLSDVLNVATSKVVCSALLDLLCFFVTNILLLLDVGVSERDDPPPPRIYFCF